MAVEGFELLGDWRTTHRRRLVGDAGADHRHGEGLLAGEGADGVAAHAAVDRLGGQGVADLVGGDVTDPSFVAEPAQGGGARRSDVMGRLRSSRSRSERTRRTRPSARLTM
jgi:hypothetical protein